MTSALDLLDGDVDILREIAEIFMETSPTDVKEGWAAILSGDHEAIAGKAHELKGSASNIGGDRVRAPALEMERAAKPCDSEKVNTLYTDLEKEYDTVKAILGKCDWKRSFARK